MQNFLAQRITNPQLSTQMQAFFGWEYLAWLIPHLINLGLIVGAVIFFFMLIAGGIQWITSGGNKQTLEDARRKVMHAFIGLFILFVIFAVLQILSIFFGVDLMHLTPP